jgi:hypothetical protein
MHVQYNIEKKRRGDVQNQGTQSTAAKVSAGLAVR